MPSDASNRRPADTPAPSSPTDALPPAVARWVKSECGRAKYLELARRPGPLARVRRWWFVLVAALRDWRLPPPDSP
ncbi:MAG: hypothetical protein VKO44_07130 [Cyanobacteriota bacterium]|nr:hypothetical protein [Cyanobacteriota bacterium]